MKLPVKQVFPNFAEGWNGKADPTDLPPNAFSGKNWLPSRRFGNGLEKVRVRRQDLLSTSADGQDDRLSTAVLYSGSANYADYPYPNFPLYDDIFFAYSNSYSLTSLTTAQTPTGFALWHGTPANAKVKFGIRLEREAALTTTKSLVVAIRMSRYNSTFDANRLKLTATLYPTQTTGTPPSAVANISTPTITAKVTKSGYQWVEIHFLSTSGTQYLSAGEYYVNLTDSSTSGANSTNHYIIALSDTNTDPYGWAVCVNNAGTTTQALADCYVFQRKGTNASKTAQDDGVTSATMALRTLRDANISNALGSGATTETYERGVEAYHLSDGYTIYTISNTYGPVADRLGISGYTWDGALCNQAVTWAAPSLEPTDTPRFIGKINTWATHQRSLICGGIGGLAVVDFTDVAWGSSATPNVMVPDIGNRVDTVDYEWVTTHSKDADVYPPVVKAVFKAGINPGRLFAVIDDTLIWSGGTTAATAGSLSSWSAFATVQFGDSRDTILKACWFKGYILLFTQNGDLYFLTGEPPVDPSQGYGNLRADYLTRVGQCTAVEVSRDGVWFATEEGSQLWFMDGSFVPRRVDDSTMPSIKVNNIYWDAVEDRVWVASERHAKRAYLTAVTTDNTLTYEYEEACSYVLDGGKWYKVQRALDTDTTANRPSTLIYGPLALKCGAYWDYRKTVGTFTWAGFPTYVVTPTFTSGTIADITAYDLFYDVDTEKMAQVNTVGASTLTVQNLMTEYGDDFYTIRPTPYFYLDFADGFLDTYNSAANTADPDNSTYRASTVTADLYTKEIDFTEESGLMGAVGAIKDAFFSGYLVTGSTCTIYAVEQDGTETEIATLSGDQSVSSPATAVYRVLAGPMNRVGATRLKITVSGKFKDVIRNAGFTALAYGQKPVSA